MIESTQTEGGHVAAEVSGVCQYRISRGGVCGRRLSDPCGYCALYDRNKVAWDRVFDELGDAPRIAVEGDI